MIKYAIAAGLALVMGVSAAAPVEAGYRYRRGMAPGAAAAVGVLGGLAIGAAIASSARAAPAPVYVAPPPAPVVVEEERCFVEKTREWVPGWGWEVRRRTICE